MLWCWFTVFSATILKQLRIVLFLNFKLRAHSTILLSHAIYLSILDKSHPLFLPFIPFFHLALSMRTSFDFLVLLKLFFRFRPESRTRFDARHTYCSHAFFRLPFLSIIIFFRSISEWNSVQQQKKNSFEWKMLFDKRKVQRRKGINENGNVNSMTKLNWRCGPGGWW